MSCLEITTSIPCLNSCSYCAQAILIKKYGRKDQYMTLSTFKTCLGKVPRSVEITFSGYAECFQNEAAASMIRLAVEQGYTVNLYTTLRNCRHSDIDRIRGLKFNAVVLHLPDEGGHMICVVDDDYLAIARRFRDEVGYTSAVTYGLAYPALRELFPRLRVSPINYQYLHTRAGNVDYENRKIELRHTEYKKGKIACGVAKRHGMERIEIGVLLPNGNVALCCQTYDLSHILGNLITDEYEDLFTSPGYLKVLKGLESEKYWCACRTCHEAIQVE